MIREKYTDDERYLLADRIWQRLGSQRFSLMTGCKIVSYGEKDGKVFLLMSVGKNGMGIGLFEVAYDEGRELYDVSFMRRNGTVMSVIANYSGVCLDILHTLFARHTGSGSCFMIAA